MKPSSQACNPFGGRVGSPAGIRLPPEQRVGTLAPLLVLAAAVAVPASAKQQQDKFGKVRGGRAEQPWQEFVSGGGGVSRVWARFANSPEQTTREWLQLAEIEKDKIDLRPNTHQNSRISITIYTTSSDDFWKEKQSYYGSK